MDNKLKLSWIIPCYNEELVIKSTFNRVTKVCDSIPEFIWEIIFVDDGSNDNTKFIFESLPKIVHRVVLLSLSKNYGHQTAVQAGIDFVKSSAVIIIDGDLQDPPELAESMIQKWKEGYNVVYGVRLERESETFFKKFSATLFYRVLKFLSSTKIPVDAGDFRLIDKKIIEALKKMPEKGRYLRGLISWAGYKQTEIKYKRSKRYAGKSKYPLKKMVKLAIEGITSFSTKPLKIATFIGIFTSLISLILMIYILYIRLFTNSWVVGWAGLAIIVLFMGGIQLICMGIIGEYLGTIFIESKNRPLYFLDSIIEK